MSRKYSGFRVDLHPPDKALLNLSQVKQPPRPHQPLRLYWYFRLGPVLDNCLPTTFVNAA